MLQSLVARSFPKLVTQRVPRGSRGLPGLLPLSITDHIAQHQHAIDVVPTPTHTCAFETCLDDEFVGYVGYLRHPFSNRLVLTLV
jgi:hypothetical protein